MISAGIDCGAQYTKAVIINDQTLIGKGICPTGVDFKSACDTALSKALDAAGMMKDEIIKTGGVGAGKSAVPSANLHVEDIEAMAKAAVFFFPEARTVTDVGAEEGRVARMDATGKIIDSAVNERCAAGAGMFITAMAKLLDRNIEEMGPLALQSDREIPMNAQCVVFAESEVMDLLQAGTAVEDICRAVHEAMAGRIVTLISRIGVEKALVMMGGTAKNPGLMKFVKEKLRVPEIVIPDDPEYGAAVGAALMAAGTN
jgi:benzoyl-CoA reductase subunit D